MKPHTEEARHALIELARRKAFLLYEGIHTPHRSCGICLAETFNLPTRPYQALRRGGITGEGQCGAIKAGELVLGEYFGDPDPTGKVTDTLRNAVQHYATQWKSRVNRGTSPDIICNTMTGQFATFTGPERMTFCTNVAADVAELVAETLIMFGAEFEITPIPDLAPHADLSPV